LNLKILRGDQMEFNGMEVGRKPVEVQAVIFETLAQDANLKYWSPEALTDLYKETAVMINEIEPNARFSKYTKQCTEVNHKTIWNTILRAEGMGLLNGMGFTNRFGDKVWGNPEHDSVVKGGQYV
jgi:hypothetical protein